MRPLLLPLLSLLHAVCARLQGESSCDSPTQNSAETAGQNPRFAYARNPLLWAILLLLGGLGFGLTRLVAQNSAPPKIAISRHAINNNGRIEGSAQQLLGEGINLNSGAYFGGDLQVPGTPNVNVNGQPTWSGQQDGGGSSSPSGYNITVNSGSTLRYLVKRSDPIALDAVSAPPNPTGNRNITIDNASQVASIGSWSTVHDLTLNSGAPNVMVPPGTYGTFQASNNGNSGFTFGVVGSSSQSVYNLQSLTLNSNTRLTCVSPVKLVVKNGLSVNSNTAILGSSQNQNWFRVESSGGDITLNSGSVIYGAVRAPANQVMINGTLYGTAQADRLTVNSGGSIKQGTIVAPTPTPAPTATPIPTPIPNRPPVAVNDSYTTAEDTVLAVQSDKSVLVNDSDPDGDALSVTVKTNVTHGTLTLATNGTFTYTPALHYSGTDSFVYNLSDGKGHTVTATATITVNHVNHKPTASGQKLQLMEDGQLSFDLSGSDIDGDALTYAVTTQPAHGALTGTAPHLTYTPAAHFHGTDSLSFKVNDGALDSDITTINFTVVHVNHAPQGRADLYQVDENKPLQIDAATGVLANDTDPDGDALTAILGTNTAHGTLGLNPSGAFAYAPAQNFSGTDSFTYIPRDNGTPSLDGLPVTVTIVVNPVNQAPVAQDGTVTTNQDVAVSGVLSATDANNATATLLFALVDNPSIGSVTVTPDGHFTYTPGTRNSGDDSFTFRVTDPTGLVSNLATETIVINRSTNPPVAVDDEFSLVQDTILDGASVLANDTNVASFKLDAVGDSQTMHGTLALQKGGRFTYTPTAGFVGDDSFTYHAHDSRGAVSNTATVTLHVTHVNHAPVVADDTYTVSEDATLNVAVVEGLISNDSDPDIIAYGNRFEDALTVAVAPGGEPRYGTLTLAADGSFQYQPRALHSTQNATDGFTYTLSDGRGGSATAHVTLNITAVNHAPIANDQSLKTAQGTALPLALTGSDADGESLTFALVSLPTHGTLSGVAAGPIGVGALASAALNYSPNASFRGDDSFTFTASDARGLTSNTATVTIHVSPINHSPKTGDDAYQASQNTALTIAAPGVLSNDSDPDGDALTVTAVDDTQSIGKVAWQADGSFVYTPATGWFGVDGFNYTVSDGQGGTASGHVSIGIPGRVNHAPVAVDDAATVDGAAIDIQVLSNDSDPDGDVIKVVRVGTANQIGASSAGASVSVNSDGTIHYAPPFTIGASDSFSYTISDPDGASATAQVQVTINKAPGFSDACDASIIRKPAKLLIINDGGYDDGEDIQDVERQRAVDAGYNLSDITVWTTTDLHSKTTAQIAAFDAMFVSEYCDLSDLNTTKAIWSPAVTGNIVITGADPIEDGATIAKQFMMNMWEFAASGPGTGLIVMLGDDYNSYPSNYLNSGDFLSSFGHFEADGGSYGGAAHVVYPGHLVMRGISDADLSSAGYASASFTVFPDSFKVLATQGTSAYVLASDCRAGTAPTPTPTPIGPDTTAPHVSIQYPGNGDTVSGLSFVTGQASDDHDAPTVTLTLTRESDGKSWDGAQWLTPTQAVPATELSTALSGTSWSRFDGPNQPMPSGALLSTGYYNLRATATDKAGNFSRATARVGVDNGAPQIAITLPAAGATVPALDEVRGTASDDLKLSSASVALQRNGDGAYWAPGVGWVATAYSGIWQNATFDASTDNFRIATGWPTGDDLSEGDYTLFGSAFDGVGHRATTSSAFTISLVVPTPLPTATPLPGPTLPPPPAAAQPDGTVFSPDGTSVGANIFNADGTGQIGEAHVAVGGQVQFTLQLRNASDSPDTLAFSGAASKAGWTCAYQFKGIDITDQALGAQGWQTPLLAAGESVDVALILTAPADAIGNSTFTARTQLFSTRGTQFDSFGGKAIVDAALPKPSKPDAWVRALTGGDVDHGDNVYNTDGTDQTAQSTGVAGAPAVYIVTLQNDGTATDSFKLFGPAHEPKAVEGNALWNVRYFDAVSNGTDITAQVTDGSWASDELAPAAKEFVRVEVTPGAGTHGGDSFKAALTLYSARVVLPQDVVVINTANSFFPTPTPTVSPTLDDAAWVSQNVPTTMIAGQRYSVTERFTNTGGTTWNLDSTLGNYGLVSESPEDNLIWGMKRVTSNSLDGVKTFAPGQTVVVTWDVLAPSAAGTYDFGWRMSNNASTPGRFGTASDIAHIVVTAPAATPTPVATATPLPTPTPTPLPNPQVPQGGSNNFDAIGQTATTQGIWQIIDPQGNAIAYGDPTGGIQNPNGWNVSASYIDNQANPSWLHFTVSAPATAPVAQGYQVRGNGYFGPAQDNAAIFDVVPAGTVVTVPTPRPTGSPTPTPVATPTPTPPPPAPAKMDATVAAPDQSVYVGDNFYSPDGQGVQNIAFNVQQGQTTAAAIGIENNGDVPAKARFFGPASSGGWLVRYAVVTLENGSVVYKDVTAAVTSTGFVTPTVLHGPNAGTVSGGQLIRDTATIEVGLSPAAGVNAGDSKAILVRWTEDGNAADTDAVTLTATATASTNPTPGPTVAPTPKPTAGPTAQPTTSPTSSPTAAPTAAPTAVPTPQPLPQAAPPVFHPAPGAYNGVVKVTLDDTAEPQVAIYYTLDRSDPTQSGGESHRVTGAIFLAGTTTLRARAYVPGKRPSEIVDGAYTINPDGPSGASGVKIESPTDGTQISKITDVKGSVNSPNLAYWKLTARLLDGDSEEKTIAQGQTNQDAGSKLGTFDPTLLLNGLYRLRLQAFSRSGKDADNSEDVQDVWVRGGQKIGQFSLTFNDLTLPVAGLPISVTRTYDSRDTRKGDFGIGWSLSTSDVRLQSNGPVGGVEGSDAKYFWRIDKSAGGLFGPYYNVTNLKKRLVSITLPDGKIYAFQASLDPAGWSSIQGAPDVAQVNWDAQSGTHAKLKSVDESGAVTFSDTGPGTPIWLQDADDDQGRPYDPKEWELTLPNGSVFHFTMTGDMSHGGTAKLDWVKDLTGNTLTFDTNGITSTNPAGIVTRSVSFGRDALGYIQTITDPDGKSIGYVRDGNGNLTSTTDRVGNVTTMDYANAAYPHYLTSITDARGVQATRNDYDAQGRLSTITDAAGKVTTLDHSQMSANQEIVTDRRGTQTQINYDDYGNVIGSIRQLKTFDGPLDNVGHVVKTLASSSEYGDPNNPELPTKMTDPLGRTTLMSYTPNGMPATVTQIMDADPADNRVTSTTYNQYNAPLTVTDARGVVVASNSYWKSVESFNPGSDPSSITFQPEGALKTSTDANGITTFVGYNSQGRPAVTISGYGTPTAQTTRYSYDYSTGNLLGVADNNGHATGFSYNADGVKTGQSTQRSLVGPDGAAAGTQTMTTQMILDNENRVVQTILPDGATTQTHYNAIGKVDYTVDALRRVTNYHYDDRGERDLTTYADGTSSKTYYDDNGQSYGGQDRSDRGSATLYDSLGRSTASYSVGTTGQSFSHADGSRIQSTTTYDDAGQATASVDELGHISRTSYDAAGEATSSTIYDADNAGKAVTLTSTSAYDKAGRTIRSTDALGRYSVPQYDDGGRVTFSRLYDRLGTLISTSETHYDELGRVDYTVDAAGHMKRLAYDNLSRLIAVIQASQGLPSASGTGQYDLVTQFGYDEVGHKIWQSDAAKRITRFGYDVRGRMIWRALPMGQIETMSYNVGGQLESSTDFRGDTTTFVYDVRGRTILKTPDARLQEAQLSWEYPDENTRIAYRGASSVTQHYDAQRGWLNRVDNKVVATSGTTTHSVSYSYNPEGQKTATNSQSGSTLYTYDVLGRLATIQDEMVGNSSNTPSNIASYSYDAVGNLSGLARGNGVNTSYGFDEQNRLTLLSNSHGANVLSQFGYTLRGDGKRTGIAEQIVNADAGRVSNRTLAFDYDAAGKLTKESGQNGLGYGYENTWSYDSVGNRVGTTAYRNDVAGATQSWAHQTVVTSLFNDNDQLTTQTSVVDNASTQTQSYTYDKNGAEQTVANQSGAASTGSSVNGWDFEGKLRTTATADAGGAVNGGSANAFDAQGDRLWHVENVGKPEQKTISYVVDTDTSYSQVVEENAPDKTDALGGARLQARYVWGQGLAPLAMWRRGSDGAFKLFYFVSDGQESVRQLTDTSGALTDSYYYDAWGNGLSGGSGSTVNPFRYTGQQLDSDGRYYLRARFYNPGNGRFLSHDPLMGSDSDPLSMHRYLYAGADGVNAMDPSGRESLAETLTSSAISGGMAGTFSAGLFTVIDPAHNLVEGLVIGGEIGLAIGIGEANPTKMSGILINGAIGGAAAVVCKVILVSMEGDKEEKNELDSMPGRILMREFLRGFAGGSLSAALSATSNAAEGIDSSAFVGLGIAVQDLVTGVFGKDFSAAYEKGGDSAVGTLLIQSAVDSLIQATLDYVASEAGERLTDPEKKILEKAGTMGTHAIEEQIKQHSNVIKNALLSLFAGQIAGADRSLIAGVFPAEQQEEASAG